MAKVQEANDTFTDTDDTLLTAHTSDSGDSWTQLQAGTTISIEIVSNIAQPQGFDPAAELIGLIDLVPSSADYDVTFDISTTSVGSAMGLVLRVTDIDNYYSAGGQPAATSGLLRKRVSSTFTTLASSGGGWNVTDNFKFDAAGTALELFKNSTSDLTATDSDISIAGKAGLGFGSSIHTASSTGVNLAVDNFEVNVEIVTTPTGTPALPFIIFD